LVWVKFIMKTITEAVLAEVTDRLVHAVGPDKVVLFGSRARGDARTDSDVDLLVIKSSDQPRHLRVLPLYRALRGLGIPKDILWVTPEEVEQWREVANHVVSRGLREGRVLYDKHAA
jgi:predicted nucleotidyltransferase